MPTVRLSAATLVAILACTTAAGAQQRPLDTEDAQVVGAGKVLVEVGAEYLERAVYPVYGLTGNLLRAPRLGLTVGLSSIADLELTSGSNSLSITERTTAPLSGVLSVGGTRTTSVEDLVVATKIRVVAESETRPAFGVRFATKLPNASNERGLGLDTTDFTASLLAAKAVGRLRVMGNVGLAILGNPLRADAQNDVAVYGLAMSVAAGSRATLFGEFTGRKHTSSSSQPPGAETRAVSRAGLRVRVGNGHVDAGVVAGLTDRDPTMGFSVGYSHVFQAFRVP